MSDETQTAPEFDQGALYSALKAFLVKKGYLPESEAENGEWSLIHNNSWSAYSMNKLGVSPSQVPWNYASIPAALLADPDFVLEGKPEADVSDVTAAVVEQDASNLEPVDTTVTTAPAPAPASTSFVVSNEDLPPAPAPAPAPEGITTEVPVAEQTAAPAPSPDQMQANNDTQEGPGTGVDDTDSESESEAEEPAAEDKKEEDKE